MSSCIIYVLYCGITKTYNWTLFLAISAIFIEGLVLILNNWQCPLTNLARKHGDETGRVTDMFYPKWFLPHVFRFSTVLFVIGIALLVWNYMMN